MEGTARSLELTLYPIEVRGAGEFERAFAAIAMGHADGLGLVDVLVAQREMELVATEPDAYAIQFMLLVESEEEFEPD
jgi:hypothetical protein